MCLFEIMSPVNRAGFPAGKHARLLTGRVWAMLSDSLVGHHYLQNLPAGLGANGSWPATNIHLGHELLFVKMTANGHARFLKKGQNNGWGAFDRFLARTERPASGSRPA